MPKFKPATCKHCGKKRRDGWYISNRGRCLLCGVTRQGISFAQHRQVVAELRRVREEAFAIALHQLPRMGEGSSRANDLPPAGTKAAGSQDSGTVARKPGATARTRRSA